MDYTAFVTFVGLAIDSFGVLAIAIGAIFATSHFLSGWLRKEDADENYSDFRRNLGKTILVGLEFLVAGDIIRSISTRPTFTSVAILGLIVLIRSFLTMQFEKEVSWHFPWHRKKSSKEE